MGKILKKTVEQVIYVSSDGRETILSNMADPHLVNAFGQACQKHALEDEKRPMSLATPLNENEHLVKALREEILRRLKLCTSNSEN